MDSTLTAFTVAAILAENEDNIFDCDTPSIEFTCKVGKHTLFTFLTVHGSKEWMRISDACAYDTDYIITFDCNDGDANVVAEGGIVTFNIAKYSDGGILRISIPAKCCVDAFHQAHKITESWNQHHLALQKL